ncbi:MAG: CBS domain-containing protein [Alphaproteobacteria bacterium]|nr:CBS domain-containing protein [Alphaproteobacteria bacterium]
MKVHTILKQKGRGVVTVQGGHTMEDASKLLAKHRIGAVVVTDTAGRVVGVLSERDVVRALAEHGGPALARPVREFMTQEVVTCGGDETVDQLMELMTERRIRHLPVLDGGELVGIVSIGDVVKMKIAATEFEAEALKQYIAAG